MKQLRNGNRLMLALVASLMSSVPIVAHAVDTITSNDAPDLAGVRSKIKVRTIRELYPNSGRWPTPTSTPTSIA